MRANHRSVPSARSTSRRYRVATPSGVDRLSIACGREHAGVERLGDALAGHRVDDVGGVAREQHPAVREPRGVERRRDGPGAVRAVGLGAGTEDVAQLRAVDDLAPLRRELLARARTAAGIAQHAEADVGAAAAEREDPRVPGQEVGVEQHPHPGVVDAAEVLAERVPGAELGRRRARPVGVEHAAHGGVVAVGGDHPLRGERGAVVEIDRDPVVVGDDMGDADAVAHRHAFVARAVDERGVELGPGHHTGVFAVARQRELDLPPAR